MRIHSAALIYFDAVRRAGSIREAARKLNVASSAVNRQILKLEDEIGTPLFERRSAGVTMTTAGEMLARHVVVVLQDLERVRSDIEALRGARVGTVSVAAVEGVCAALLPAVIHRLHETAPGIRISAMTMGSWDIPQALETGLADVGIGFSLSRDPRTRQVRMVGFKLGAIMAPDHPLADKETVTLSQCCSYPLVWPGETLSVAAALEPHFGAIGRQIEPAVISDSVDLTRQLVARPPMIGFQTPLGVETLIERGEIVHVPLETAQGPIWSELGIYVRADRSLPVAIDLFLQSLTSELEA